MKRLVLLTKQYPFGQAETYVHNEIPYLSRAFDEVVIIPYDQYAYKASENRLLSEWRNVSVFEVNNELQATGGMQKLVREARLIGIWLKETITGRESVKHIKRARMCMRRLRQCAAQAAAIEAKFPEWSPSNTLLYNYWLHYGVLVCGMLRRGSEPFKITSRAHSLDMFHKDWVFGHLFLPFERHKLQTCDRVYPASEHGLRHFNKTFPEMRSKFHYRALGVWDRGKRETTEGDVFTLASATSVSVAKRLEKIPELMSKLPFASRWIHYGSGSGQEMKKLQDAIEEFGQEGHVELRGQRPNEEVLKMYASEHVDLYANVSEAETIPVAVMEPASFGIPVMGTAVYGTPEIINDDNGLLIPVDFKTDEVAASITQLKNEPGRLAAMGEAARHTFEIRFNADTNFRAFASELAELIPGQ